MPARAGMVPDAAAGQSAGMLRTARFTALTLSAFSSATAVAGLVAGVALAANAAGADGGDWMKVLPAGKWSARDGRGPFSSGQITQMQQIVERSLAYLGETEMMVDYGHDNSGRAAGWVKELQARDDGIWARVEWTEAARTAIKAGEFRYISPFITDKKGQVDLLLNFALVNMPALDLAATAASTQTQNKETEVDFIAKLRAALGLDASAPEATILEAIAANAVALAAAPAAALKPVALAAGLAETATAEQLVAAVKGRSEGEGVVSALRAELTATATALAALQTKVANNDAAALVDAAISEGRVGVKPLRDHYIARAAASAESFASVRTELTGLPALAGGSIVPPAPVPGTDGKVALSAEQRERVKVLGITTEAFVATLEAERNQGDAA